MNKTRWLALLAALALTLGLLAGCGGDAAPQSPDPAPAANDGGDVPASLPDTEDGETAPDAATPAHEDEDENIPASADEEAAASESDPEPEPAPAGPAEESAPATLEPEPAAEPEAEPEGENITADGTYTISVTLEGGSGRAAVESPAKLRCENGTCWATIVWSSPNYDYMKVDGQRYDPINTEGNSTFEIPVSAFDQPLAVIADTIAMSEPHEVEYTLTFDSASMQDA